MEMPPQRTVFALATAPGRAAVAVVRVAGPAAFAAATRLGASVTADRRMRLVTLRDPDSGAPLDSALVVGFAAGASFTGTETVEFHLHGSPAVTRAVLTALHGDAALTPADPGDFTRMAFDTGRLTLPEVEALADLIDAETEGQRRQALSGLGGRLARQAETWREALLSARALIEAGIDFADEAIDDGTEAEALAIVARTRDSLRTALAGAAAAAAIRQGFTVALVGPPNAGKSSLINALAGRDLALVSALPGTTRDSIEARIDLGGLLVTVIDTAGLRAPGDALEAMGITRTRELAEAADLRVHVTAPGLPTAESPQRPGDLSIWNKSDLGDPAPPGALPVSALSGAGLDTLVATLRDTLATRVAGASDVAHDRQRHAVADALSALDAIDGEPAEIIAESLRHATLSLDSLIGRVDIEEVLGTIFGRFCIGK